MILCSRKVEIRKTGSSRKCTQKMTTITLYRRDKIQSRTQPESTRCSSAFCLRTAMSKRAIDPCLRQAHRGKLHDSYAGARAAGMEVLSGVIHVTLRVRSSRDGDGETGSEDSQTLIDRYHFCLHATTCGCCNTVYPPEFYNRGLHIKQILVDKDT